MYSVIASFFITLKTFRDKSSRRKRTGRKKSHFKFKFDTYQFMYFNKIFATEAPQRIPISIIGNVECGKTTSTFLQFTTELFQNFVT